MKKKWKKPELIVLVRSTLAENVLMNCKVQNSNGPETPPPRGCTAEPGVGPCQEHVIS
jgi:hypothetical protein